MAIGAIPEARNREGQEYTMKTAESFSEGAIVLLDGSEEIIEAGADPAVILGIAAHGAGLAPDATKITVFKANEGQKFWFPFSGTLVAGDLNQSYGVVETSNVWYVDQTETSATRVYVHRVDLVRDRVLVSVLAANRQAAP